MQSLSWNKRTFWEKMFTGQLYFQKTYQHKLHTQTHALIYYAGFLRNNPIISPIWWALDWRQSVCRHRQIASLCWIKPQDIMALFSVLLLSKPGTEAQDGTLTKLTELPLGPAGSRTAQSHSDTWWSHRTKTWILGFLFLPSCIQGRYSVSFRSFTQLRKNRHLALIRIPGCLKEFTVLIWYLKS